MTTETTVETTAGAPAPVENAAPTPADEGKAPELGSTDTPANAAEPAETEEQKRNKVTARERIGQLTRDKRTLEATNRELQQRLEDIEKRIQPKEPVKPKLADFGSDAEYESAMDLYYHAKAEHDSAKARQTETVEQRQKREQEAKAQSAQKFVTDLQREKANYQDIEKVMADPTFTLIVNQMDPELITLIQSSEKNIALAYHLGTHIEEADWIASLPPIQAARELAKLESRLETPKPKTVSNAPPPVKPVNGGSVSEKDIYDPNVSYKDYDAVRKKQRAARKGR